MRISAFTETPRRGLGIPATERAFTLVEIMIVVVIIGLLAAMAIPAFNRLTTRSQDRIVLNNARQLASASDQYFMENGLSFVPISELVGADKYVKSFATAASETYPANYTQGVTITITGVSGVRTVTYVP